MDLNAFIGLGGIPIVQALVELVKRTFPNIKSKFLPGIAVAWGIILNVAILWPLAGLALRDTVVVGIITGLAASGLYQWGVERSSENRLR